MISFERLCQMNRHYGDRVVVFLRNVTRKNIDEERNVAEMGRLAKALDVPPAEFSTLVRSKLYAKEKSLSCDPVPDPTLMAFHVTASINQLLAWIDVEAGIFQRDQQQLEDAGLANRDDVAAEIHRQAVQDQMDEDVARHDQIEAAAHGMNVAEYSEFLEDPQNDMPATD